MNVDPPKVRVQTLFFSPTCCILFQGYVPAQAQNSAGRDGRPGPVQRLSGGRWQGRPLTSPSVVVPENVAEPIQLFPYSLNTGNFTCQAFPRYVGHHWCPHPRWVHSLMGATDRWTNGYNINVINSRGGGAQGFRKVFKKRVDIWSVLWRTRNT